MIIDLTSTTSSEIASALLKARRNAGSPAMGMVGTIVVVVDEASHHDAMKAANEAGREHPSRVLVAILRPGRGTGGLDAEVRVGEGIPGEAVLLRLHGELAKVPESVITPAAAARLPRHRLVAGWRAEGAERGPAGRLGPSPGDRRGCDSAGSVDFTVRAEGYAPGDTDFAWSRLTPWRALMAAALDQYPTKVTGAEVVSAKGNASADLMAAWLQCRLGVPVEQRNSRGPGITAVRMFTPAGPIALTRPDGAVATFSIPGQPDRPVALKRRNTSELLSEELRRLDPDDVYAQTLACLVGREKMPASAKVVSDVDRRSAQTAAEKAAARTSKVAGKAASPSLEAKAAGRGGARKTATAAKKTAAKKPVAKKASAAAKSARKSVAAKKAAPAARKAVAKKATGKRVAGRS